MPINNIRSSKRALAAIALVAAAFTGSYATRPYTADNPPAAVVLATDNLILPWEGMVLKSHWDRFAKIWDICAGITRINGKPVQPGMSFTKTECVAMTRRQIFDNYYVPLVKEVPAFTSFPLTVQASMISGAYNFGVGSIKSKKGMAGSSAMRLALAGKFREACEAQTAWNKAGGQVVPGLVKRREMGDVQRMGEAELCVSGLK